MANLPPPSAAIRLVCFWPMQSIIRKHDVIQKTTIHNISHCICRQRRTEPQITCTHKKLRYRRGTALRAMLVNSCYVSRGMGVKKVQTAKVTLKVIQGHCWYFRFLRDEHAVGAVLRAKFPHGLWAGERPRKLKLEMVTLPVLQRLGNAYGGCIICSFLLHVANIVIAAAPVFKRHPRC